MGKTFKKICLFALIIVIYEVTAFFYGERWLKDIIPIGDFPGNVAVVAELKENILNFNLSNWSNRRFCGCPNTFLWNLSSLLYVPFTFIFELVKAVKIATLFYLGLAGASMFGVCLHFTKKMLISFWAGFFYMTSPIFLFSLTRAGHVGFSPFYAVLPLTFLSLWQLSIKSTKASLFRAAFLIILTVWIDTERAFTTLPFIFMLATINNFFLQKPAINYRFLFSTVRRTSCLLAPFLLAFLLGAFFLIPVIIEQKTIALFNKEALADSLNTFGLNNIFHLLDRNGFIVSQLAPYLPQRDCFDAGNYYLGISTILIVSSVLWVRRRQDFRVRLIWIIIFTCLCSIWIASGVTSIYGNLSSQMARLYKHLRYSEQHPYLLPAVFGIILGIIFFVIWLRKKLKYEPISMIKLFCFFSFLLLIIYTPVFSVLAKTPFYSHMRNPGYFMSVLPPFLLVLAASLMLSYLTEKIPKNLYIIVILLVILGTIIDYYPYRKGFNNRIPEPFKNDFLQASVAMKNSQKHGRYLSRESYSPLSDMYTCYTNRPTAWYWLNWSCSKGTHAAFLNQIYPNLHRPDTIEHALALAGLFNVRFVTYNLTEGPLPPETQSLRQLYKGEAYAVYENLLCRDYLQTYKFTDDDKILQSLDELVKLKPTNSEIEFKSNKADFIEFQIKTNDKILLVLSQSVFPGWSLKIDSKPATFSTVENTLPSVALNSGIHNILFEYRRPWYHHLGLGISVLTIILSIILYRYIPFSKKPYDET